MVWWVVAKAVWVLAVVRRVWVGEPGMKGRAWGLSLRLGLLA